MPADPSQNDVFIQLLFFATWSAGAYLLGTYFAPINPRGLANHQDLLPPDFIFLSVFSILAYLIIQSVLLPLAVYGLFCWGKELCIMSEQQTTWAVDFGLLTAASVVFFIASQDKVRQKVWGSSKVLPNLLAGVSCWFLAFPLSMLLGKLSAIIMELLVEYTYSDQVAVKFLKDLEHYPVLRTVNAVLIAAIIPVAEEVLFRGFLFNALKRALPIIPAILTSAIVFAFFHFDTSQGYSNVELLVVLTTLGCFLAWIYHRQKSLWASIGLHCFFNLVGVYSILTE